MYMRKKITPRRSQPALYETENIYLFFKTVSQSSNVFIFHFHATTMCPEGGGNIRPMGNSAETCFFFYVTPYLIHSTHFGPPSL